jgi:hypothetical protein
MQYEEIKKKYKKSPVRTTSFASGPVRSNFYHFRMGRAHTERAVDDGTRESLKPLAAASRRPIMDGEGRKTEPSCFGMDE